MREISAKAKELYKSGYRNIVAKLVFNDETVVTGDDIKSYSVTESVGSTDSLSLGNVCSKKLEIEMYAKQGLAIQGAKIQAYIGIVLDTAKVDEIDDFDGEGYPIDKNKNRINTEFTSLGVFYADEITYTDNVVYDEVTDEPQTGLTKTVKITAYDAIYKIDRALGTSSYTLKADSTPTALVSRICNDAGVKSYIPAQSTTEETTINAKVASDFSINENTGKIETYNGNETDNVYGFKEFITIPSNADGDVTIKISGLDFSDDFSSAEAFKTVWYTPQGEYVACDVLNFPDETDNALVMTCCKPFSGSGEEYKILACVHLTNVTITDMTITVTYGYITPHYIGRSDIVFSAGVYNVSARTLLGYAVGLLGCNAYTNTSGVVTFGTLQKTPDYIRLDEQLMSGLAKSQEKPLEVFYVTSGSEDNVVTVGSGDYGINFANPYITHDAVNDIYNFYKDLHYMPCTLNYIGNPSIECGDIITVTDGYNKDYDVIVASQTITVSGGLTAKIDSNFKTDISSSFVAIPTSQKLEYQWQSFEKSYKNVIENLLNASGGYVQEVRDDNGNVRALAITQSPVELEWEEVTDTSGTWCKVTTKTGESVPMWIWSQGGLRFTKNGGTSYEVAINMNGEIYANYLQSPLGYIGGWILTKEKIFQRVKSGTTTYEFTLKADDSSSSTKKAIYSNTFTEGRNSESSDADNYKTENFYIKRNGEIFLANGSIAGWNIDDQSFYADIDDYRAYIQKPKNSESWVFSTQQRINDGYYGVFIVKMDGSTTCTSLVVDNDPLSSNNVAGINGEFYSGEYGIPYNPVFYIKYPDEQLMDGGWTFFVRSNGDILCGDVQFKDVLSDGRGYEIIASKNYELNIGKGTQSLNLPTLLHGYNVYLNAGAGAVYIEQNSAQRFEIGNKQVTLWDSTDYRDYIASSGGFLLSANSGNSNMHLSASKIICYGDLMINHTSGNTTPLYMTKDGIVTPASSSKRYKKDIEYEIDDGLNPEKLYELPVAQYEYKEEYADRSLANGTQIGIIAEDVDVYYPNACIYNRDGQPESWQDRIMIPAMLKLIQEQHSEIESLKTQIAEINDKLNQIIGGAK